MADFNQIQFPSTQVPSTDPNALDDYEEGTWTPSQGAGLTVVGTFSSSGTYTKIGRQVTVHGQINGVTSVALAAGGTISNNLPFTVGANSGIGSSQSLTAVLNGSVIAWSGTLAIYGSAISATPSIAFTCTYFV